MSIPLHVHGRPAATFGGTVIGRVTTEPLPAGEARGDYVLLFQDDANAVDKKGYAGLLSRSTPALSSEPESPGPKRTLAKLPPCIHSLKYDHHLVDGDVVSLHPSGYVRTLYRRHSHHNAIFATDRCNSWCLMCSQPPKPVDDSDRISEHLRLVELIDSNCRELGITGGEPTLLKNDFLRLVAACRDALPTTALHVLSNGRLFYYGSLARRLARIEHPDLMIGVPLYSPVDAEHDHVVQAKGAFHQTVVGLQNLGRWGVPVEIRVVVHRLTWQRLEALAEMIYRNFPFTAHVAFMGLEMMGFAVPNARQLWIDPWQYREALARAVRHLAVRGLNVSIYNHQLCVVPPDVWPYCRASISDWKNDYLPECAGCAVKEHCGGFFTSSLKRKRSEHIQPLSIQPADLATVAGVVREPCLDKRLTN